MKNHEEWLDPCYIAKGNISKIGMKTFTYGEGPSKERKLEIKKEALDDLTCRICLKRGKLPIFLGIYCSTKELCARNIILSDERLCESIFAIGGIKVSVDDPYPKFLCHSCDELLRGAILFRKTAKLSDDLLKKRKAEEKSEPTIEIDDHSGVDNDEDFSVNTAASLQKVKCSKPRICNRCNLEFSTFKNYCDHLLSAEHKNKKYPCKTAKLSDDLLKKRKAEEKSETTIEIDDHSYVKNYEDLTANTAASLQKVNCSKPRVCKRCNSEFSTFKEYCDHLLSAEHENKKYPCKTAKLSDDLLKKPKAKEKSEPTIEIDDHCYVKKYEDFSANTAASLQKVNCLKPRVRKQVSSFQEYTDLLLSAEYENKKYPCNVCKKSYTPEFYKRHLCLPATTHVCDICGKKFTLKAVFSKHRLTHFYDLPYQCSHCPYRGRFPESLKMHMRTHTGEKPYQCEQCLSRFINKGNLIKHMLVHRGEHDFHCEICGRGFYYKRELDLHIKVDHTGIREHACRICGKAFGYRTQMMKHERKVHKREKLKLGRMPIYLQVEKMKNQSVVTTGT